jgi:hypothetical protein
VLAVSNTVAEDRTMHAEHKTRWYLVELCRGGIYRIEAASADLARQRVTYDFRERVKAVALDEEQHDNPVEDEGEEENPFALLDRSPPPVRPTFTSTRKRLARLMTIADSYPLG